MSSKKKRSKSKAAAAQRVQQSPTATLPVKPSSLAPSAPAARARRLAVGEIVDASTEQMAQEIAEHLVDDRRTHPVLVLSTPTEDEGPLMDAKEILGQVGEHCDVVVLPNGAPSFRFASLMPHQAEVYGGAGRVYPINLDWMRKPSKAPLRFCWPQDDPQVVARRLVDDAFDAAVAAGLFNRPAAAPAGRRVVATFESVLGDGHHAMLRLEDRRQVMFLVDRLGHRVDPVRLLRKGQELPGVFVNEGWFGRFEPDPVEDDPIARVRQAYPDGSTVLARVDTVGRLRGRVLLHPDVPADFQVADEADLRRLVDVGDVVLVRLMVNGLAMLATLADEDAPSHECIPVIPGGPAWLTVEDLPQPEPELPPEPAVQQEDPASIPAASKASGPSKAPAATAPVRAVPPAPAVTRNVAPEELAALRSRNADLYERLSRALSDVEKARDELKRTRADAREAGKVRRSLQERIKALQSELGEDLFDDPAEQLGHDIHMAWLRRFRGEDRDRYPLRAYTLGAHFIESVASLQGIERSKIVDVLVEVLTGLAKDLPGRDLHPLSDRVGGSQRVRHDGARAWRCALQVDTASARRLHYWTLGDRIEFDSVGVHDAGL